MKEHDKVKVYGFGRLATPSFYTFFDGETGVVIEVNKNANSVWVRVKGRGETLFHVTQCVGDGYITKVLEFFKRKGKA